MTKFRFIFSGKQPIEIEGQNLMDATAQLDAKHPELGGLYDVEKWVKPKQSWVLIPVK